MNKLASAQRNKAYEFRDVTKASEEVAIKALKNNGWNLEAALEYFYNNPPEPDPNAIYAEELYTKYKDPNADVILVDGISLLCSDLEVDPQDIVMLILSWHMKAATMCEYTKEEFVRGLTDLGVNSMEKFRGKFPFLRDEIKQEDKFGEIYNFAFDWAKEKGQKSMALETAIGMWQLLFNENKWPLVEPWCQFVQVTHNKGFSKDTWCQLLQFARTVKPDLTDYDAEGAWPCLIDEFVDYLREKKAEKS